MGKNFQEIQAEWTQLDLGRMKLDPKRPRQRQRRSVNEIAKSIREFGFIQPIVVDEHFVVIIGHGRLEAAKYLEYKTVPVVVMRGLTDAQRQRLQIADNRLSELSDWDEGLLIEQMERLFDGSCPKIPGFSAAEIDDILGIPDIGKANCELPPQREKTLEQSELHLLQVSKNKLWCGRPGCTEQARRLHHNLFLDTCLKTTDKGRETASNPLSCKGFFVSWPLSCHSAIMTGNDRF